MIETAWKQYPVSEIGDAPLREPVGIDTEEWLQLLGERITFSLAEIRESGITYDSWEELQFSYLTQPWRSHPRRAKAIIHKGRGLVSIQGEYVC